MQFTVPAHHRDTLLARGRQQIAAARPLVTTASQANAEKMNETIKQQDKRDEEQYEALQALTSLSALRHKSVYFWTLLPTAVEIAVSLNSPH